MKRIFAICVALLLGTAPAQKSEALTVPGAIAIAVGIGVVGVGAAGAILYLFDKTEGGEAGGWGEDRFKDLDVRFYESNSPAGPWQEVYAWNSPPSDFKLYIAEEGVIAPLSLQSNERQVTLPKQQVRYFRVSTQF
jgi:hypothetical protein